MQAIKSIKDLAIAKKSRKGTAAAVTRLGAYWLVMSVITMRDGGDGIGQNLPNVTTVFEMRHYRNGTVKAVIQERTWHQNTGLEIVEASIPAALELTTIEDLIQLIKSTSVPDGYDEVYFDVSDEGRKRLETELAPLPAAAPAPDET